MTRLLSCLALLSIASLLGCQGDNQGVGGTITLDGQPLPHAEVVFTPTQGGRPATAVTDAKGQYDLVYTINQPGTPPGEYLVRIRAARTETGENGQDITTPEVVPPKYNRQSELLVEVKKGQPTQFDFDLKSE